MVCCAQSGSQNFETAREAMVSPLAKRLMSLDGVAGVFFGSDFVTVTKKEGFTWPMLKPDIFAAIMDHFSSGLLADEQCTHASRDKPAYGVSAMELPPVTVPREGSTSSMLKSDILQMSGTTSRQVCCCLGPDAFVCMLNPACICRECHGAGLCRIAPVHRPQACACMHASTSMHVQCVP